MKQVIDNRESVKANAKFSNNRLKYLLGKIMPGIFGQPIHLRIVRRGWASGKQERDSRGRFIARYVLEDKAVYNTVTTVGKNGIADQLLASPSIGKPTHMAVGTGTGGTTTLNSETDRNALSSKTRNNAVVTMVGDWAAGDATAALTEAGVFNASSNGDMYLYTTFSVINKGANDALTITWTLTIS